MLKELYDLIANKGTSNDGPKVWVLNKKYCISDGISNGIVGVKYTYHEIEGTTPFSVDAIKNH